MCIDYTGKEASRECVSSFRDNTFCLVVFRFHIFSEKDCYLIYLLLDLLLRLVCCLQFGLGSVL